MRRCQGWFIVCWALLAACTVNPAERNNSGNDLYTQGNYPAAIRAYQAAQVIMPDDPVAYYNAGSALAAAGQVQAAIDNLNQALKTADESLITQAYYNLGNVYFDMALYSNAVEVYREVLLRRPDDDDARFNYELALSRSANEAPQEDEQEPDPTATDTAEGGDQPTPTPSPGTGTPENTEEPESGGGGDSDGDEPITVTPEPQGEMSEAQMENMLDSVEENQQTLREYLQRLSTPGPAPDKDW